MSVSSLKSSGLWVISLMVILNSWSITLSSKDQWTTQLSQISLLLTRTFMRAGITKPGLERLNKSIDSIDSKVLNPKYA